jgi:DnaJ-class molecular chaperone
MEQAKDYYSALGIVPNAELAVIKSAYKAMLSVYHPDRFKGPKETAHTRSVEINEAYEILSNIDKRKQYDNLRKNTNDNAYSYREESQSRESRADKFETLEKDWQSAIKGQRDLDLLFKELKNISVKLAFAFRKVMLESKDFDSKKHIADKMELEYLTLYFGTDKKFHSFAKALILGEHRDAARKLNKKIIASGEGVDAERVIFQVEREFNLKHLDRKSCNKKHVQVGAYVDVQSYRKTTE